MPPPAKEALLAAGREERERRQDIRRSLGNRRDVRGTRLDGLVYVNAVIDCADRECVGLNVSQRNDAREAAWALEDALIRRFGALPKGDANVILRTDNALAYASELYRALAKS